MIRIILALSAIWVTIGVALGVLFGSMIDNADAEIDEYD